MHSVHTSSVLRKSLVLYSTISPEGFSFESSSTASDARLSILPMSCMEAGSRGKGEKRGKKGGRRGMENCGSRRSKRVEKEARGSAPGGGST